MADWTPDLVAGLQVWLKADAIVGLNDGDEVATWPDSSGQGHDATRVNLSGRPTYQTNEIDGKPVVQFDHPSIQRLEFEDISGHLPTAATLFILCYVNDTTYCIFSNTIGRGAGADYWRFDGTGNAYLGVFRTARIDNYPATMPTNEIALFGLVSSAVTYEFYKNATSKGAQAASYDSGAGEACFRLGAYNDTGEYFNGQVAELVLYDSELSEADRQKVEGYLAWKWGQEANLPGDHPYKAAPPVVAPVIVSATPDHGVVGTEVTITGLNFGAAQGGSTVEFNGTDAGVATSWSDTEIVIDVPSGASTGNIVVNVGGADSNGSAFEVDPTLTVASPDYGWVGDAVVLTGVSFGAAQGSSYVTFNGTQATAYDSWSDTSITCRVPSGATTGNIVVVVV